MNYPVVPHKHGQSLRELTANKVEEKVKFALLPSPDWLAVMAIMIPINKPGIGPRRRQHAFTRHGGGEGIALTQYRCKSLTGKSIPFPYKHNIQLLGASGHSW